MLVAALILSALLAHAVWQDLRRRRIPNAVPACIALCWLPFALTGPTLEASLLSAGTGLAVLAGGFVLWRFGWLGAGDVKLTAALSLWAGPALVLPMLLAIGLAGGVLALACVVGQRLLAHPLIALVTIRSRLPLRAAAGGVSVATADQLPYGVAVAAGGGLVVIRLLLG